MPDNINLKLKYDDYRNELEQLKEADNLRVLRNITARQGKYIFIDGKKYLNLSSNDYLGISADDKFVENLGKYGFSNSSSRLLAGNCSLYEELESEITKLYNRESCLVFNSGYNANTGIISALFKKGDVIFSDKLNHASIVDGIKLSGADFFRYKHLDCANLEELLQKNRGKYKKAVIISESVFSMDGDTADLKKLVELKNKYDCFLMVDEAHAVGVYGDRGCGICEAENLTEQIDIIVGTFGKALASFGAFAVCDDIIRNYLINKSRPFIFTTALPPANIYHTLQIIKSLPDLAEKRKHLAELSSMLRNEFKGLGFENLGNSQIIPVIMGENETALETANKLQGKGFLLLAVRHPAVPKGTARIRISLNAELKWNDIKDIPGLIKGESN